MGSEKTTNSKKGIAIKIVIPIMVLIVLAGVWFIKNNNKNADTVEPDKSGATVSETGTNDSDKSGTTVSDNSDFELHVTEKIDLEKLKSYGLPIVIDFGADSCIPCKEMAPVLKELNSELKGKAIVRFVDVWKYRELAQGFPISVIPTQIFIDANGKPFTPKNLEAMQMEMFKGESGEHDFTAHKGGMTKEQLLEALKEMGMK